VRLRPELEVGRLPGPMLAVQVTRPAADDGGVVGVFVHHAVADGNSVWQSIVRGKALDLDHGGDDDTFYFLVPMDCRRRLLPDDGEGYFGNCSPCPVVRQGHRARPSGTRRRGRARGRGHPRRRPRDAGEPAAGRRALDRGLRGDAPREVHADGVVQQFAAYETDMGWGAPSLVELVSSPGRDMVLLLGSPDGGVQVTVELDGAHMDLFAANFLQV